MSSPTYYLPINVIIEMMKGGHEHMVLRARLPALPAIASGTCVVDIVVGNQGVQGYSIVEQQTGQMLHQNGEALSILQQCGSLAWVVLPQGLASRQERPIPQRIVPFSEEDGKIPRRTAICPPSQMQIWPHKKKRVFLLVNGSNTIEHIAHILTQSPHEVSEILLELQKHHMIDL